MVTAGEGNVPGGKELSDKVMTHTNRWRFLAAAVVAFAAVNLSAQTRIDLPTQAKGAAVTLLSDCQVVRTSASVLTVGAPCNVKTLGIVTSFASGATITLSALTETGTARLSVDTSVNPPTLKLYVSGITTGNVSCSGMACVSVSGAAFGADDIQLAAWTASSGSGWNSNGGTDLRSLISHDRIVAGAGLQQVITAGAQTMSVDNTIPRYLTGTASLDFGSIANTACDARTFTLAGALPTDGVAPIWPSAMDAGFTGSMRVSAADTVEVRYCNLSGNSVDPAPQTFGAVVLR
jgi:hypothetical protein